MQSRQVFIWFVILALGVWLCTAADGAPEPQSLVKESDSQSVTTHSIKEKKVQSGFERFRTDMDPVAVLKDPQVKRSIRSIMGTKDEKFWDCTQVFGDCYVVGDDLFVCAFVRGLNGIMNSALNINLATGKVCACYLDASGLHIFGVTKSNDLPAPILNYNHETLNDKRIVLDKADWTSPPVAKKVIVRRKLNLLKLTGTYERNDSRFENSTLLVRELPGNKIKFEIQAFNGGQTGQAEGTVAVVRGHAAYRSGEDGNIELKFVENKVEITGNDSYFCGQGVTLLGTYSKTDDRPPKL